MVLDSWAVGQVILIATYIVLASLAIIAILLRWREGMIQNMYSIILSSQCLFRSLFFSIGAFSGTGRVGQDLLDDLPGLIFFTAACSLCYILSRPYFPTIRNMRTAAITFRVLVIINVLVYLAYFCFIYFAGEDKDSFSVYVVEIGINILFSLIFMLVIALLLYWTLRQTATLREHRMPRYGFLVFTLSIVGMVCLFARVVSLVVSTGTNPDQFNFHQTEAYLSLALLYYIIGEALPASLFLAAHLVLSVCRANISESKEMMPIIGKPPTGKEPKKRNTPHIIDRKDITFCEVIGRGSFGIVHRAKWKGLDVAVKNLCLPADQLDEAEIEAFCDEMELISGLNHPNILQYLGSTPPPSLCLVTEYMAFGPLSGVLKDPELRDELVWEVRVQIAKEIALGMNYLHHRDILHRDLCPGNLLVTRGLRVKVADFGLARIKQTGRTMTKGVGTPAYMAPEVFRDEPYTDKADVYSFGVTLWQLVTLEEPFADHENPWQLMCHTSSGGRLPIPDDCPELMRMLIEELGQYTTTRPSFDEIVVRLEEIQSVEFGD